MLCCAPTRLCADGPVRSLVDLSLALEYRCGRGACCVPGSNYGSIEIARLRRGLAGLPLPRVGDGIVLAVDVSPGLRPDAQTGPQRLCCHVRGRAEGSAGMIPAWPYSIVTALMMCRARQPGRGAGSPWRAGSINTVRSRRCAAVSLPWFSSLRSPYNVCEVGRRGEWGMARSP